VDVEEEGVVGDMGEAGITVEVAGTRIANYIKLPNHYSVAISKTKL